MAQQQGVDYSFSRPGGAYLASLGYTFAFRYLASSSAKRLSAAEAADLQGNGLSIGLVFEDYANPLDNNPGFTDYNGGVADATLAVGQANALGVPADRPIYVAVDVGLAYADDPALNARYGNYFQGWADTIGVGRVGFYGGGILWNRLYGGLGVVSGYFWQASASSWSGYQIPYAGAIVLQGLSGSPAGTDPDTAYISDFGQWPAPSAPPPPHTGGTIVANVGYSSANYSQPDDKSIITPNESYDQVIYSVTTTDATLANGSHNGFYQIPTNLNQAGYPLGTFSYDGGVTFNDFGFALPAIPGSAGVYPSVQIQPAVTSSGTIVFNGVNNTGVTVNLTLNVALLATYNPGTLPSGPQILGRNLAYTNIYPKLTSDATTKVYSTYRRIAKDNVSGTGDQTVAHGQTSVPNIMFWVNVGGSITLNAAGWASTGSLGVLGVYMNGSNLHFHVDAGTYNNLYYRAYKDN